MTHALRDTWYFPFISEARWGWCFLPAPFPAASSEHIWIPLPQSHLLVCCTYSQPISYTKTWSIPEHCCQIWDAGISLWLLGPARSIGFRNSELLMSMSHKWLCCRSKTDLICFRAESTNRQPPRQIESWCLQSRLPCNLFNILTGLFPHVVSPIPGAVLSGTSQVQCLTHLIKLNCREPGTM